MWILGSDAFLKLGRAEEHGKHTGPREPVQCSVINQSINRSGKIWGWFCQDIKKKRSVHCHWRVTQNAVGTVTPFICTREPAMSCPENETIRLSHSKYTVRTNNTLLTLACWMYVFFPMIYLLLMLLILAKVIQLWHRAYYTAPRRSTGKSSQSLDSQGDPQRRRLICMTV